MFLDDLVKINDVESDFGLKASGLAKLKKIFEKTDMPSYVSIPDFFSVPVSMDLSNSELKEAYAKLTSSFNNPMIILARSSDPNERPGKFETHPSLYLPDDKTRSFENWINAARKVKESGAIAILGQPLVGKLENFRYNHEYDWDFEKNEICEKFDEIPSFGGSNTSFFMNSTNFLTGDKPTLVICYGVPSKIARGDKDVCLIEKSDCGLNIVNLNHSYIHSSFSEFKQKTIDIITLDNPDIISSIAYNHKLQKARVTTMDYATIPLIDNLNFTWSHPDFENTNFYPHDLFNIMNSIRSQIDKHVELEGCVNDDGVFLFQLREYELPKKNLERLSVVHGKNLLLKLTE